MDVSEDLEQKLKYLGLTGVIIVLFIGFGNLTTSDPVEVGPVEIDNNCVGIDTGPVCLGMNQEVHTTYNYDNYTHPEEGTEDYYRRAEAELMIQAYSICDAETSGMDWLEDAEYENMTGDEWYEKEEIDLLGCENTFYREMTDSESSIIG